MLRKLIKRMFIALFALIALFVLAVAIFVNTAPQMGQAPQGDDLARIAQSPHFSDGVFVNLIETSPGSFKNVMKVLPEFLFGKKAEPTKPLPVRFGENMEAASDSACFVTWYGHSAFLIEMEGKRLLIDPMLGDVAAPVSFGAKRYPYEREIPWENLTNIDAVILSHDHYDHLDYESILRLQPHVGHFYTALGVGSHLKKWGIPANKITELDWWQATKLDSMTLVACPARHFSGRGIADRNATQWASWAIQGAHSSLYFSGDGGYGPHFKEIGEKLGPFDLAMMECGQYNENWADIHMMPEQSVQGGLDVRAKLIMPIHWGAFTLALHDWYNPIKRFKAEAQRLQAPIAHPYIGERFCLGKQVPQSPWWEEAM